MAQPAYDLEHFAVKSSRAAPRVRVAKREKTARQKQFAQMRRILLAVGLLVLMVWGVLYNNAQITEVQSDIKAADEQLAEENALNFYLSFELDNRISLNNMEEQAQELGLERVDEAGVSYFRVEEATGIQVRENIFSRLWNAARDGFLSILDYLTP